MKFSKITSCKLKTPIHCPTSKSYANRALIIASLKPERIEINDIPESQDVHDLLSILESLKIEVIKIPSGIQIINSFPECEQNSSKPILLPGSEGGTTVRFITPLLALGNNEYHIPLLGRMAARPMDELLLIIKGMGANIWIEDAILKIKGPISLPEELSVDCSKTTQFATALYNLKAKYKINIKYNNVEASKKYLDMTESLIKHFSGSNHFIVPADFSGLGYLLAYGVLNQDLVVSNVFKMDMLQADSVLIEILKRIGARIEFGPNGLSIFRTESKLSGFEVDGSECIDLVPTLMFIASFCDSETKLTNIKFLTHKESDRLLEMMKILDIFKIEYFYDEAGDVFTIFPLKETLENIFKPIKITTANDHRMVMVSALYLKTLKGGSVAPMESVNKSFPNFFSLFS
ncbi:MAG: 3-phosphoshikimate 1-carboxyvinyltransferase [Bacteriovoracaceae bacterium]|jgi:3-phosphoshikimate 1-carboxyvinyltransferase